MDPQSFPYNVDMDEFQRDSDEQENSVNNEEQTVSSGLGKTIGNLTGFMSSFTHGRASQAHEASSSATKSTGGAQDKTFAELGNEKALNEAAEETEAMAEQVLIQTSVPDADIEDDVPATIGNGDLSADEAAGDAEGLVGAIAQEALEPDADADHASSGDDADIPSSARIGHHAGSKAAGTTTPKGRRGRPASKPVTARTLQAAERKATADAKARQEKRVKKTEVTANGTATPATGGKRRGRPSKSTSEEQLSQVTEAKKAAVKAIQSSSKAAGTPSANTPAKRRGRPPKDASAPQTTAAKATKRGRPSKSKEADSNPQAGAKRRGRPPKSATGEAPAPIAGKKRGRPAKGTEPAAKKQRTVDPSGPKRRGRPPKSAAAAPNGVTRPRGRPPLHKKRGRPALAKRVFAPAVPPEPTKPAKRNTANSTGKVLRTRG